MEPFMEYREKGTKINTRETIERKLTEGSKSPLRKRRYL